MTGWTPNAETNPTFSDYALNRNKEAKRSVILPFGKKWYPIQ